MLMIHGLQVVVGVVALYLAMVVGIFTKEGQWGAWKFAVKAAVFATAGVIIILAILASATFFVYYLQHMG